MKIYLAARYGRKQEIADRARELEAVGVMITSRWHDKPFEPYPRDATNPDPEMIRAALDDLRDIDRADALLVFTDPGAVLGGGHHWEAGYAYGQNKIIYLLGPRQTVFYHLASIRQYHHWQDLKMALMTNDQFPMPKE
jgi:nucleoside 2-deoxyribosyltransferase